MSALNIMFVGDSITQGTGGSTNFGGYRGQLLSIKPTYQGLPYRTVGSNTLNLFGGENKWCGASGYRIDQLNPEVQRDCVQFPWNIALLHVGTNDATQRNSGGTPTLATSQANLTIMLDYLRAARPNAQVFFMKIIPSTTAAVDTLIDAQNTAFAAQIAARADAAYITIVDVYSDFKANANWATEYMSDATHPNNYGYRVMAVTLANALTAAGY